MSVEIRQVLDRKALKAFVRFPEKLYRHNRYYVPPIEFDQMDTLDPRKNPASSFCDFALWMAYRDGEAVGRVAAIVNRKANEQWNHQEVRFGWYDFIDDREVSRALMDKVEEFGRERGMDKVVGPLGFTDFDPEGLLIEGFDKMNTMPLIYNDPYYKDHIEEMGFVKDADWIEYRVTIPEQLPDKMKRVAAIVQQRTGFHLRQLNRRIIRKEDYGHKIFHLINECYKELYNFTVLPDDLADKYLGFYLTILDLRYVSMVENEKGDLIAFGITMNSLEKALQKSRGQLFPFGWWYLLKSMFIKHEEGAELLLVGVHPDYRRSGVNALLFADMFEKYVKMGVKWAETNAQLEDNSAVQLQFEGFEREYGKRRRSYIKDLK
ncbi:MAG: N-acetyltransferase [Bacteroidales bacterium]|nr:N-acetyltransferase [Bacteroidales bacterium]